MSKISRTQSLEPDIQVQDHGHLLVVDDDSELRLLVSRFLQRNGYQVSMAPDARVMAEVLARATIDLVLLDVMLPGRSGLDLCRDLRARSNIPIIMLTARGEESDRVSGLEVGADDYVTKPFSSRELLARVRAALRRARAPAGAGGDEGSVHHIAFDGWSLDVRRRELTSPAGVLIDLSSGEYDLLVAFIEHANRVVSRERLMEFSKSRAVDPLDRTIDVQVSRLRKKLSGDGARTDIIKTVRGSGYMFAPHLIRKHATGAES